jgi:SpoVK/Ycf46/Vps4 family AAA+-type ATPase
VLISNCSFDMNYIISYLQKKKIVNDIHSIDKTYYQPWFKNYGCILEIDYQHCKNIFIPIHKYINKKTNKLDYVFIYNGYIVSQSLEELKQIVIDILLNYKQENCIRMKDINHICELVDGNTVVKGIVQKNITFDKIHFEQKDILLDWVDRFNRNNLYPAGLCMSNKLGILLYGPPGTGKTGCISALANKLNRGIVLINSLNVCGKSKDDLESTLRTLQENNIFVFDEFDYLLTATENNDKHSQKINYQELLLFSEGDERKKILESIKEQQNTNRNIIDQAYILKLLDGIGDTNGRIIIATTNNPEKINKAFLRPGRFDLKLKLGFCTFDMFQNIVKNKFNDIFENTGRIQKILEKNITPLVLINTLIGSTNFEEMLDNLEQMVQQEYNNILQN